MVPRSTRSSCRVSWRSRATRPMTTSEKTLAIALGLAAIIPRTFHRILPPEIWGLIITWRSSLVPRPAPRRW